VPARSKGFVDKAAVLKPEGVSTDATHISVSLSGSNMAAYPVMVPDFFIL